MKPTIDEQIEAVMRVMSIADDAAPALDLWDELYAALDTLNWVKRHAPTIKAIRDEFPGAKFSEREED